MTSELRDYKSRLRRFMVATFPRTKRFSRAANRTPAPSPAPSPDAWKQTQIAGIGQVQYAVVQSPPRSRKRPQIAKAQPDAASGTIGTAFDYR
ncbi:MAG: hypothetical protein ACRD1L_10450, partial [Terriglobales bacterium]